MPVQDIQIDATAAELRLELRRLIAAPREKVFGMWTRAASLERFICPGNTGSKVTADVRVGGKFHIDMFGAKGEVYPHDGEYLEIDAPRRLQFTWVSPSSPAEVGSVVTIDFLETAGGTEVVLVQERFANAKQRGGHSEGWSKILDQLEGTTA